MTQKEREEVHRLRLEGKSYTQIAGIVRLSRNTVKSICQRLGIQPSETTEEKPDSAHCKQCGVVLVQNATGKRKQFCSDLCRRVWWKEHQDKRIMKSAVNVKCAFCGRDFKDYQKNRRKYCCHACFIRARFGDKKLHDKRAV